MLEPCYRGGLGYNRSIDIDHSPNNQEYPISMRTVSGLFILQGLLTITLFTGVSAAQKAGDSPERIGSTQFGSLDDYDPDDSSTIPEVAIPDSRPQTPRQPQSQAPRQPQTQTPKPVPAAPEGLTNPPKQNIPDYMRSVSDPNHPFYQLRLSSQPVDPNCEIAGQSLTICEMLSSVRSPQARNLLLHEYWELSRNIAKYKIYNLHVDNVNGWLEKYPDESTLQSTAKLITAKRRSAELNVIKQQYKLAVLLRNHGIYRPVTFASEGNSERLPIPVDYPVTGTYDSSINEMVKHRQLSSRALFLGKTLPIQQQLIESKTEEFAAENEIFTGLANSQQKTIEDLLQARNQLTVAYIAAADEIIDYNNDIADYVCETVGPELSGRDLLSKLILLNSIPSQTTADSGSPYAPDNPANSIPTLDR